MNEFPGSEDEQMRRLLNDAVSDVDPGDTLDSIRARTAATPLYARRPWIWGAGAAVLATAATVAAVATMGGNTGTTQSDPGFAGSSGAPTTASASGTASDGPTDEPSATAEPSAAELTTVPVYYIGDTSRGPRLFREFHQVQLPSKHPGAEIEVAGNEALSGSPLDGDYQTSWPAGTTANISYDGFGDNGSWGVLLSNSLTDLRQRPAGMSDAAAEVSLQQLVYTVQAAGQNRSPVQFYVEASGSGSNETDMVLGVPASKALTQGSSTDVLAQVWIIDPAEGAQVKSGFEVSGLAAAFEANVQWELMQGDTVVKKRFTMAKECCTMSPYSFTVDAPPGEYTLVVHDEDASGGEGFAPWRDTKSITVVE